MSDTLAPDQHTYFYRNFQPAVLSVALATDQKSSNGCYNCTGASRPVPTRSQDGNEHLQHADSLLRDFCVVTLHSISIFVEISHPSS